MEFAVEFGPSLVQGVRDAEDGRREDEHVRHCVPELGHVVGDLKQAFEFEVEPNSRSDVNL